MRKTTILILLLLPILLGVSGEQVFSQNKSPVKIAFDENSERIDLITSNMLQNYTLAQRGSVRFFLDRLDTPDKTITFYHDGINNVSIDNLILIEKVQSEFSVWRLRYKNGTKNTPRIHHKAVSFIPIEPNGKAGERVYVLLDDLKLIEWGE
ncbi:hypothetical protein ACFL50_00575 [Candidatus Latescibacterota bacterium]